MAFNQLLNRSPATWLIALGVCACFAYYQYAKGYDFAQQHSITTEAICDNAFNGGRRSYHFFKVMGCKSFAKDVRHKLNANMNYVADKIGDKELIMMMQLGAMEKEKSDRDIAKWLARCDGDVEACMENTPQDNNMQAAAAADNEEMHTALTQAECEEVDNAGFLPECREW